ncbi:MAG: MBL fold metallo-hydrolase [Brevibacterium yomogidense]|uniref:Hydroxyacylglutathione hydrolase n=1 Tax=Brevibacterium yomogidense TaxID=946573 RepID=A0A1X6XG00_9MICO|nr:MULTISPECIES: MBL fold metallo-hydrolase [Brevibacterium]SLM98212.1 Hydroxyacylglutathione hydrolase [Brevibacterium yomogidense]
MEITGVRAQLLDVNCYAVAAGDGAEGSACLLIDAGYDCADDLADVLSDRGWRPAAILLTHGHADHVLGLPHLLERFAVPVHLGRPDLYRLDDPAGGVSAQFAQALAPLAQDWVRPEVRAVDDGDVLEAAGLTITATLAPGHTEGSMLYAIDDPSPAGDGPASVLMSGDVLFAGSIGRTDLPGGDPAAMQSSLEALRDRPDTPVLPGHGPGTRLSHELTTNPFF